jgi:hypothetical protein
LTNQNDTVSNELLTPEGLCTLILKDYNPSITESCRKIEIFLLSNHYGKDISIPLSELVHLIFMKLNDEIKHFFLKESGIIFPAIKKNVKNKPVVQFEEENPKTSNSTALVVYKKNKSTIDTPLAKQLFQEHQTEEMNNKKTLKNIFGAWKDETEKSKKISPTKTEKTDIASYMGKTANSDYDKEGNDIPASRGNHINTLNALSQHASIKQQQNLPKYEASLNLLNQNYKPNEEISADLKRQINKITNKSSYLKINEKVTYEEAKIKLEKEINSRKPAQKLTASELTKHNKSNLKAPNSPLISKINNNSSRDLSFG